MENNIVLSNLGHTWILDLDGTIVKHNGYKIDGVDTFLEGAKEFLDGLPQKDMIVFLTSRTKEYQNLTEEFLRNNGVRYHAIIFDAPYGERILVNDNKPSGLSMSISVCTKRDEFMTVSIVEDESL